MRRTGQPACEHMDHEAWLAASERGSAKETIRSRNVPPSESERTITTSFRQPRRDKGYPQLTPRDLMTLTWVGEQYAVRFDHLQRLLARQPGKPTRVEGVLSTTTTSDIVSRWQHAGLVDVRK